MNRPTSARMRTAFAVALTCVVAPISPTAARADDGGAGFGSPAVQPAPPTQATPATGDGGTLLVQTASILGHTLQVQGTMASGQAGRPVAVQTQRKDGRWVTVASATTTSGGAFDAAWRTRHIGRFPVRAVAAPAGGASAASAGVTSTGVTAVTVYRQAKASFYGPGFFGKQTACGQVLQADTLGVAHRGLPCGTLVSVYYQGHSITVPVIDRGPFANGATWDLTSATAQALGFSGVDTIGAVRLPKAAAAP